MRIGIAGTQTTELVAKSIKETLSDVGFESFYFKNDSKPASDNVSLIDFVTSSVVCVPAIPIRILLNFHRTIKIKSP